MCQYDLTFGVVGDLGAGKTLTLTALAVRHIIKYEGERPIFANYHLNIENINNYLKAMNYDVEWEFNYITEPSQFEDIRSGFFGGDELWIWADSRTAQRKMNRFVSQILIKSRKRDLDIVYTTQTLGQIDKRIRKMTDLIAIPSMNEKTQMVKCPIVSNHSYQVVKYFKFYAPPYFEMYDTTEEIALPSDEDD